MRPILLLALLGALAVDHPCAQAAQSQQSAPVFSTKTTLLTLDVTVLDRDGKPVAGLEPGEFEIKVNGTVRPVQALAYLEVEGSGPRAPLPPTATAPVGVSSRRTAVNAALPERGRVFVIVVDDLSFEPGRGKPLFVSAESFVSSLPPSDFVGFALTSGSRSISPTLDRRAVLDALKHAVGVFSNPADLSLPPVVSIGEALEIAENGSTGKAREVMLRECFDPRVAAQMGALSADRLRATNSCADDVPVRASRIVQQIRSIREQQLQSLESIVTSLRQATGIKHVVFLSNGVPVTRDISGIAAVARTMGVAGVQVSTMVEEGDIDLRDSGSSVESQGGSSGPVNPGRARSRREDDRLLLGGAQTLTDMAGGQFYRVIGQPQRFFDRVTASASAVYRLGVSLPRDMKPGQDLTIAATVKRPGASALATRYAEAPEPDVPAAPEQRVLTAVTRGDTLSGVPMTLGAIVRRGAAPGQVEIGAAVSIPGGIPGPLTTVVGLLDGTGALRSSKRSVPAPSGGADYSLTFAFPVAQGSYQMRVAVADSRGNVGAVSLPINASLKTFAGLEASDVLTWTRDADGRMHLQVLDELPRDAGAITAMIELYPPSAAPAPEIAVRFVLLDSADRPLATQNANLAAGGGVLRADASFDLNALAPGLYSLRADIAAAGRPAGSTSTSFRRR